MMPFECGVWHQQTVPVTYFYEGNRLGDAKWNKFIRNYQGMFLSISLIGES